VIKDKKVQSDILREIIENSYLTRWYAHQLLSLCLALVSLDLIFDALNMPDLALQLQMLLIGA
jgi:hypothetical protein